MGRMLSFPAMHEPGYLRLLESGELDERVEKLYALLRACTVCPRDCGNDRLAGVLASCASGENPIVSSYTPHFGEEPSLSGTRGAGNIFFGNCNLRCVYCQNYQISQDYPTQKTNEVSVERLAEMMLELQERGCHNIGFVSPTHFAPQMAKAILLAARGGLRLPIVYNTNAYDSVEVLRLLEGDRRRLPARLQVRRHGRRLALLEGARTTRRARGRPWSRCTARRARGSSSTTTGCSRADCSCACSSCPTAPRASSESLVLDRGDPLAAGRHLADGPVLPDPSRGLEREVRRAQPLDQRPGNGARPSRRSRRTASSTVTSRSSRRPTATTVPTSGTGKRRFATSGTSNSAGRRYTTQNAGRRGYRVRAGVFPGPVFSGPTSGSQALTIAVSNPAAIVTVEEASGLPSARNSSR